VSEIVFACDFQNKEIVKLIVLEFEGYSLFRQRKCQHEIIDS